MSNLVLDSLEIKNFRAFKHLRIEKLGRVNLIVGKNNVGKSSVLEALRIYARRGEPATLNDLLIGRDEISIEENKLNPNSVNAHDFALAITSLFYMRKDTRLPHDDIVIGSANDVDRIVLLDIVWPILSQLNISNGNKTEPGSHNPNQEPALSVKIGTLVPVVFPLDRYYFWGSFAETVKITEMFNLFYIGTDGLKPAVSALLWDFIALSDLEKDVLNSLRIIAPEVEAVSLIRSSGASSVPKPIVRLTGFSQRVPLRSMGEGMNRMLGIALALVNAKDGMLLIDEVDTGLHYSVLPDLWKLIFEVAHRLNVQVFATSHSWDCIEAFQQAADANKEEEGIVIRLETQDGEVVPIVFDERKLNIATREHIEVR